MPFGAAFGRIDLVDDFINAMLFFFRRLINRFPRHGPDRRLILTPPRLL